ncbi:MAG: serine protease [Gemmataceae bacterium]|nr:serine protease [Gemmataceae bacterium]
MSLLRFFPLTALLVPLFTGSAATYDTNPVAPPPRPKAVQTHPWYVDDDTMFRDAMDKLTELAKTRKGLPAEKLKPRMKPGKVAIAPAAPGDKVLLPEEVYRRALPSVFLIVSVYKDKATGEWVDGIKASAWAASADGVLVTNWHVIGEPEAGEVFGAADHNGTVYPVVDFLGGDKTADVAVLKVAGDGFAPLPVATEPAPVGSWVGVLSHPGDHFFVFTQGHVTRYSKNKADDGKQERWMGITAEYASGSSGAPVLNSCGAVVGMTASTVTFDAPPDEEKPKDKDAARRPLRRALTDDKPAPKTDPKGKPGADPKDMPGEPKYPLVQMVAKLTVPGPVIRQTFGK